MSATSASGSPVTPRAAANAGTRSSDRETPGTGNQRTPSAYPVAPTASTAASRVLPTPPGPVRVTSRWSASSARIGDQVRVPTQQRIRERGRFEGGE